MPILKRIFGKTGRAAQAAETIRVFDAYGRELFITKEEWRKNVLPGALERAWNKPDELYGIIVQSLQDGFVAEIVDAARQLHRIDRNAARGAAILGIVFLETGRLNDAERVLSECLATHGRDGAVLTNLAKVFAKRGDDTRAERTLWDALEADPNQDNGFQWYWALHRERGGDSAGLSALQRIAALPGSWRAHLWLARTALDAGNRPAALDHYRQVLRRANPVPADALMQMSGDLGNHGLLEELVELCAPVFDVRRHGLQVGNNLLKAYVDQRDAPRARSLLEMLYAQQRPDWKETLLFWEAEIDKLDRNDGPFPPTGKLEVTMLDLEGPIWARAGSPFSELLPAKAPGALQVAFVAGTAEVQPAGHGDAIVAQPTDAPGRLSRALPMFLAEQTHLRTAARAKVLIPWVRQGGFVLSGKPWEPGALGLVEPRPDYLVLLHLVATRTPWLARFRLVRAVDQSELANWEVLVSLDDPADVRQASDELFAELRSRTEMISGHAQGMLSPPAGASLLQYLVGLEQGLAVSCAALVPDAPFLHAERSILDNQLHLCAQEPLNVAARLLLLSTLEEQARRRPDISGEYRRRIEQLQRDHPLASPARGLSEAFVERLYPA